MIWFKSDFLRPTMMLCSLASVISSFVIIVHYHYYPTMRTRSTKLIVWLSVANMGLGITVLLDAGLNYTDPYSNAVFGFFINYFLLCTVAWSCIISMTMSFVILKRDKLLHLLSSSNVPTHKLAVRRMIRFHLLSWLGAFFISIIPAIVDCYSGIATQW